MIFLFSNSLGLAVWLFFFKAIYFKKTADQNESCGSTEFLSIISMLLIGFFCWQLCWGNTGSRLNKMLISQGMSVSTWSFNRGTDNRTGLGSICSFCPDFKASLQPAELKVEAVRAGCSGHVLLGLENIKDGASSLCGQTCSNPWPLLRILKKKLLTWSCSVFHFVPIVSISCLTNEMSSVSIFFPVPVRCSACGFGYLESSQG